MGKAEEELEIAEAAAAPTIATVIDEAPKRKVKILVCACQDCVHWELGLDENGNGFLLCKSCGLEVPGTFTHDEHDNLKYVDHER
jgi:hypothetical protein